MKTYTGKQITKKYIQQVLRTLDRTAIWKLTNTMYGGKTTSKQVVDFVREYAPTNRVYDAAYSIAYVRNNSRAEHSWELANAIRFRYDNSKHYVLDILREELNRPQDNYTKRPIMGKTYLYWASPVYQHRDYNKSRLLPIKGNERFCEVICKLADKYFPLIND